MRLFRVMLLVGVVFFSVAWPAMAQEKLTPNDAISKTSGTFTFTGHSFGAGLGAALTIIGAGFGFGKIGAAALEGMARQPEVAGRIQTGMIIIAALLEGATFFSLIVCILITMGIGGTPL